MCTTTSCRNYHLISIWNEWNIFIHVYIGDLGALRIPMKTTIVWLGLPHKYLFIVLSFIIIDRTIDQLLYLFNTERPSFGISHTDPTPG